eukprot:GILJ01018245.1.p1 GENE.GILJ01018245.1~~GILJ01018245.1.p1  ORF type:complete len:682 (+),score=137.48 GILJ01018245.1:47-2047(+)
MSSPTATAPAPATKATLGDGSQMIRGGSFAFEFDHKPRSTTNQRKQALLLSALAAQRVQKALGGEKNEGTMEPPQAPAATTDKSANGASTSHTKVSTPPSAIASSKTSAKVTAALSAPQAMVAPAEHYRQLALLQRSGKAGDANAKGGGRQSEKLELDTTPVRAVPAVGDSPSVKAAKPPAGSHSKTPSSKKAPSHTEDKQTVVEEKEVEVVGGEEDGNTSSMVARAKKRQSEAKALVDSDDSSDDEEAKKAKKKHRPEGGGQQPEEGDQVVDENNETDNANNAQKGLRNPTMKQLLALRRAPTMALRGPHLLPPRDLADGYERELAALVGGTGSGGLSETSELAEGSKDQTGRKSGTIPTATTAATTTAVKLNSAESAKGRSASLPSSPTSHKSSAITTLNNPSVGNKRLYTIVLDLDETVVYARDGPLYARAHLRELLLCMHAYAEVVVWTAGEREYAKAVLEEINVDHVIQHLIYRHKKWFDEDDYTKDLRMLGRDMRYVLIVENTPDCVRQNPMNGIIVEDYEPSNVAADKAEEAATTTTTVPIAEGAPGPEHNTRGSTSLAKAPATDHTFKKLITLITDLGNSGDKSVPDFLASYPLLRKNKVQGSNGEMIPIFYLSSRRARRMAQGSDTPNAASAEADFKVAKGGKVVKVNRDKNNNSKE